MHRGGVDRHDLFGQGKSLAEGQHFLKKPGGAPTNVAAAIAALGGSVELLFSGDLRSFVDHSWNFLDCCHFFKLSDEEALLITGSATLKDATAVLQEKTKAVFAITLGKGGTLLRVGDQTSIVPSIPVKPVDTTGAGDAFVGAVLYQLSESVPVSGDLAWWERIVRNANKAGARTCEYMGAMEAFRHLSSQIFD